MVTVINNDALTTNLEQLHYWWSNVIQIINSLGVQCVSQSRIIILKI